MESPNRPFTTPEGKKIIYLERPTEGGVLWESTPYEPPVNLTVEEHNKAKAMGWDLDKVEQVKRLLLAEKTPTEIQKETGISRNSIWKYKKILSLKDAKGQDKGNNSTEISKAVLPNLLIFITTANESTSPLFVIIAPILLLAVFGWFVNQYKEFEKQAQEHREYISSSKLHTDFVHVLDLSFERYPIIVVSQQERIRFELLLKQYNNQGRDIILIERGVGQSPHDHLSERNKAANDYAFANRKMIQEADRKSKQVWKELDKKGYLDYLKSPHSPNSEKSKDFLEAKTAFYRKHKLPETDKARKKYVIEDIDIDI